MTELISSGLVRGLGIGSTYALLAVGFVIIYRATGVINFAQPALMILGAYATSVLATGAGLPFPVAVLAAMAVLAAVGMATERVALRPMVGRQPFAAAMVTVGVLTVLFVVAHRLIGTQVRTVGDPWGLQRAELFGVSVAQVDLAKIVVSMVAIGAVGLFLARSRLGLAMRATSMDQEVALAQGVDVGRMFSLAWGISAALAALAGMLIGTSAGGFEAITALVALKALPVVIVGGLDSIKGAVYAGLLIGVAEALTRLYQPRYAEWLGANVDVVVPYVIMIVVLVVRPYGLFGTREVERV
ncbi:branched-chain amino acid ABC transporter permease [Phytoactinopolyspora halotolerans]|uniref:Branched-chain amino acid ABC transporter permease n=1 Tax=Phytoactinopolyspora halotolerans TaxID=1981512 RepID=A0A6L9SB76_9ACTN|nr:branched-chain amino acid ABC transporter permease [Phytoactinopolyspora halotolerans]NEE02359.1 branched-chain amino acid ABC transporter permease [Phytoactinopolyspora halotolerans]